MIRKLLNRIFFGGNTEYVCPAGHTFIPDFRPGYCYICGQKLVSRPGKSCSKCGMYMVGDYCKYCGQKDTGKITK